MRFRKATLISILCLALASTAICSGSYRHIDDGELWREADTVVIGTVTSITEEEAAAETHRYVEMDVERYLKNPSESSTLVILYSIRRRVEIGDGVVVTEYSSNIELGFREGEKVLVFLEKTYPDWYSVYGGFQGKYSFIDGHAINQIGRVMNIPIPTSLSTTIIIGSGIGVIILLIAFIGKRYHPFLSSLMKNLPNKKMKNKELYFIITSFISSFFPNHKGF